MALTGWPDEPPLLPPLLLPARLAALVAEIEQLTTRQGRPVRVAWEAAVAGRATLLGLRRHGRISPNGSCRLLATADGWVALSLPRPSDAELMPALTGRGGREGAGSWADARAIAAVTPGSDFAARARLLGLAAAPVPPVPEPAPSEWYLARRQWSPRMWSDTDPWRVVDLSSLWAGPLVARLLGEAGAAVTKVESASRPDGARATPAFYSWLHPSDESVVRVDFSTVAGQRRAAELIDEADVVIEASRPRALEQLGLGPESRPDRPGRVWLSITGYGRQGPGRDWIAFGDDAAVAGGLTVCNGRGEPVFCGDAIADPITGLAGTLAVLRSREAGGGELIDLAMSRAAARAAGEPALTGRNTPIPAGEPAPTEARSARSGRERPPAGATSDRVASEAAPVRPLPPTTAGHPAPHLTAATVEPDGAGGWRVRIGSWVEAVRDSPDRLELILPAS
jgi:hypothetical protein